MIIYPLIIVINILNAEEYFGHNSKNIYHAKHDNKFAFMLSY